MLKRIGLAFSALLVVIAASLFIYVHGKLPHRSGEQTLPGLQAPVTVRFDERGVPHINANNQADLYRALGYTQAQDRLFQMEMLRRLARGELAQVLGSKLVPTDRLFRTLRIREQADWQVAHADQATPEWQALQAYLDGINAFQAEHPRPLEFDLLGIPKRPFTPADVYSVVGYMAYSFAAAFRTEPLLSYIKDSLGESYLNVFDRSWHPQGALASGALTGADWKGLGALAQLSAQATALTGLPQMEGSNAWVVSGQRTQSGKPLLAGDPHIRFSVPSVWYEAHLSAPGFELYGDYESLVPFALLGHNHSFAWTLTMFQNDDIDLIAETSNPDNPNQVWYQGHWVDLEQEQQRIDVRDADPVYLQLKRSPHGPIINEALGDNAGTRPIALWWTYLDGANPLVQAFYALNRADTLAKARSAASLIRAPGLNVLYANAQGDIAWWAAAALPIRPPGVVADFILDGSTAQADKLGYYPFSENPHEENPARGYIVSANAQPASPVGRPIAGYYNLPDRGQRLNQRLSQDGRWNVNKSQDLQLDTQTGYAQRVLEPLLPILRTAIDDPQQRQLLDQLAAWHGDYPTDSISATVFNEFLYDLAFTAFHDRLGDSMFQNLLASRLLDAALPRLAADAGSPWWTALSTTSKQTREDAVVHAWTAAISRLRSTLGADPAQWRWGKAHLLTHMHPLGSQKLLAPLLNVGPFDVPGSHEVPNNFSAPLGPAPWAVNYGPSTRRVIDMADPEKAIGILPVGQSGVPFDPHYQDQARDFVQGIYHPLHLSQSDINRNLRTVLRLEP